MENNKWGRIRNYGWLSSIWQITTANPYIQEYNLKDYDLDEIHIAPFPVELPFRLIELYSKKGDVVLDPFCGSGTTNLSALALGRKTIGYDIEQKYVAIAQKNCKGKADLFCRSSENMCECKDNSVDLCITSPPYLNLREYSNKIGNIGNMRNPYYALENVFKEVFRVLKKGSYFCLNVADVLESKKSRDTTFPYDMIYLCKKLGFKFKGSIIWDKGFTLKKWNMDYNKMMLNHEYIWLFKKE